MRDHPGLSMLLPALLLLSCKQETTPAVDPAPPPLEAAPRKVVAPAPKQAGVAAPAAASAAAVKPATEEQYARMMDELATRLEKDFHAAAERKYGSIVEVRQTMASLSPATYPGAKDIYAQLGLTPDSVAALLKAYPEAANKYGAKFDERVNKAMEELRASVGKQFPNANKPIAGRAPPPAGAKPAK